MSVSYYKLKAELIGLVTTSCIYLFFEVVVSQEFSLFIFLLTLVLGFLIGSLHRKVPKSYPWVTRALTLSLIYIPIFLTFMNDMIDHPYGWNLLIPLVVLPGYIVLEILGIIAFFQASPALGYFLSGLSTLASL